jgi:hypothetical protein
MRREAFVQQIAQLNQVSSLPVISCAKARLRRNQKKT